MLMIKIDVDDNMIVLLAEGTKTALRSIWIELSYNDPSNLTPAACPDTFFNHHF